MKRATSYGRLGDQYRSEYFAWRNMKRWCLDSTNASFRFYGARGVTIHPAWINSFAAFLNDVGPKPSPELWLCRTDLAKGYEPRNVVWGSKQTQMPKRRNCLRVVIDGVPVTTREAAELIGISKESLLWRLRQHGKAIQQST